MKQQNLRMHQSQEYKYVLTIIIATHCCNNRIRNTLSSIEKLTDTQVIIKDSGSSPEINSILKEFNIEFILIEKSDEGIYDAWNQALEYINGRWVLFMGDDDIILDTEIIEKLKIIDVDESIVYGQVEKELSYSGKTEVQGEVWTELSKKFYINNGFPHQACFHNASLFLSMKFDSQYRIAADYDFLIKVFRKYGFPKFIDSIVSRMSYGGVSTSKQDRFKVLREFKMIRSSHGITEAKFYFFFLQLIAYVRYLQSRFSFKRLS